MILCCSILSPIYLKPVNVLSQSDNTKDLDLQTMLKNYLKRKYQKPGNVYLGLVHRLDRPTGGIMVFAKTSKCAARLTEQIQNKSLQKVNPWNLNISCVNKVVETTAYYKG